MRDPFSIEQKRRLCELLNGMDIAIQLDDYGLFQKIKTNYSNSIAKFLGCSIKDHDFYEKIFEFDLVSNAYSNVYFYQLNGLPKKDMADALKKARSLKLKYFFY